MQLSRTILIGTLSVLALAVAVAAFVWLRLGGLDRVQSILPASFTSSQFRAEVPTGYPQLMLNDELGTELKNFQSSHGLDGYTVQLTITNDPSYQLIYKILNPDKSVLYGIGLPIIDSTQKHLRLSAYTKETDPEKLAYIVSDSYLFSLLVAAELHQQETPNLNNFSFPAHRTAVQDLMARYEQAGSYPIQTQ